MASSSDPPARSGTQSIERAVLLLRELAARGHAGWGLRDLARHCELDRATVYRMLRCLVQERLVLQRASDRRYLIGPLNFELGISVPHQAALADAARTAVRRLARQFRQVVSLAYLRSDDDCVCIARAGSSSYTSEGTAIRVGHRAPLLSLAGGIAILAALPAEQARAVAARNHRRLLHLGTAHLARAATLLRASERKGLVLSPGVVWQGIHSVAAGFGPAGAPVGSLVVSGSGADYPAEALRRLLPEVQAAAESILARPPAG